jgi:hypothetical protein
VSYGPSRELPDRDVRLEKHPHIVVARISANLGHLRPNSGDLDASVQDVAYLYDASASDRLDGTHRAPNFRDGVRMHHLIDQVDKTSAEFSASRSRNTIW